MDINKSSNYSKRRYKLPRKRAWLLVLVMLCLNLMNIYDPNSIVKAASPVNATFIL